MSHQIEHSANSTGLENKTVLITGAAQRVGAETARVLHNAGANIVIHYRSSEAGARKLQTELNTIRHNSVAIVAGDLADIKTVDRLIAFCGQQWGGLDVLVNNASSFYPTPLGTVTEQQWDDLLNANLKAPFFLSQAAAPMLSERGGSIVNIVDIHADRPLKTHPVYCISKAGIAMLTRSLACELGPDIRVNGVAPGAIMWPENDMDDATKQRIMDKTFLKRKGEPSDIAHAVLYLVRDANYTTGQILAVDGGRSLNS